MILFVRLKDPSWVPCIQCKEKEYDELCYLNTVQCPHSHH